MHQHPLFDHLKTASALAAAIALTFAIRDASAATDFAPLFKLYAAEAGAGAKPFSAERGKAFWNSEHRGDTGAMVNCASCHGANLSQPGKHITSGKRIEPMAPSANVERYTDPEKVEKWFKRNCKQVLLRECTAQEKGDVLRYLSQF